MAKRKMGRFISWAVVALMVFAVAGLGLNSQLANRNNDTVLRVGDVQVTGQEYATALQRAINNFAQQQGQPISFADAELLGIPQQVRRQLIFDATLRQSFDNGGLEVTDDALLAAVQEIPGFQDQNGKFSRRSLELFLDTRNMSEAAFLDILREDVARQTTTEIVAGPTLELANISQTLADEIGERRGLRYIEISPTSFDVDIVSDVDAQSYFTENQQQYMAPPVRSYDVAYILPDLDAVTDEEIQERFDALNDNRETDERFSYRQLPVDDIDAAAAATTDEAFIALVEARGLTPNQIEFTDATAANLPEPLLEAVRANGTGVYGPFETNFGDALFQVTAYRAAGELNIDTMRGELRADVARDKLNLLLADQFETIDAMVDAGSTPQIIADATPLEFVSRSDADDPIIGLTDDPNFISELDAAPLDEQRPLVKLDNGGVAYLALTDVAEAQPIAYEDVRDEIIVRITKERQTEAALARANALADEIQAGAEIATLAEDAQYPYTETPVLAQNEHYQTIPFTLAFEMFNKDAIEPFTVDDVDQVYVAQVFEIAPFDPSDDPELITRLDASIDENLRNILLESYLEDASTQYGVFANTELMRTIEAQL